MKVFQIKSGFCFNDASRKFKKASDTIGRFPPDVLFVDAPDYVFEGWGYDAEAEGDARFIQPTPPEGWVYDTETGTFYQEEKMLSSAITKKLAEISNACNTAIISGIDVEIDGEPVHFNLSLEDQANISNLFRVVELGGTEFPYQADGGVCDVYTAAEIVTIYTTTQSHITYHLTYHNALKQYVQSLTDIESVQAVTYGMELPEPYLSEMNQKLAVAKQQMDAIVAKLQQQ